MNMDDVLGAAKKVAPWIVAAGTGGVPALVTMAAGAVSGALGKPVEATSASITAAVAGATPEQIAALRAAENAFQLQMQEMQYKHEDGQLLADYADLASARDRDVKLVTVTGKSNTRANVMLGVVVVGLIALVSLMVSKNISADSALGGVVLMLIGKFSNNWDSGFSFEFGTNRASKAKDDAISSLTKK